jgi:hypothetical protein
VHDNIIRVMRWFLNARVDTNATNLVGLTALDILQGQMQIDNNEIRDMSTSSLPRVRSHEVYLISRLILYKVRDIYGS